ncbi:MAG: UDP-3-O-[3-hydroxymyristoyl] N-acetylglucosamine deacetylase [Elusimicrobia bacterium]|nr:UDP-3-O-[3-hydroxymyristoyl] N-acetylglucosamine deacetylase [Elusimicrobiota bacterium]MBD3411928.1 UDP-3-O-[3-hydroxymyristoyl] N-acetylglucosamine deacetylase [Elusimicrobiota bacterium]
MPKQTTIAKPVRFTGVGLHTGNVTSAEFRPAPADTGIIFIREDIPSKPRIEATIEHVLGVMRGTTLGKGDIRVHTVEHILAACFGLNIDNVFVHLYANEPPVADGSALPFVETLEKTGIVPLDIDKRVFRIPELIRYEAGETVIEARPFHQHNLRISYSIVYQHPVISRQDVCFDITPDIFKREIAPARTFCFDFEIEALKSKGLARGGSLENAVVIGLDQIHCKGKLRFPDEFVRHKMLDLIGDISLLRFPVFGHIHAIKAGHSHHINFTRQIHVYSSKTISLSKEAPVNESPQDIKPAAVPDTDEIKQSSLTGKVLNTLEIQNIIPHRYPFLMIDQVKVIEDMKKAIGFKFVSSNEHFFQGHFPGRPIMPGVLIIEAMAQTSCVLFLSRPDLAHKLAFFMGIHDAKFRKPVEPGSVLELHVDVLRAREKGGKIRGEAFIGDELVAEAEFMFALVDRDKA